MLYIRLPFFFFKESTMNIAVKNGAGREADAENALFCCRGSGNVDSSKAKQCVVRYRAVFADASRPEAVFR